MIKRLLGRAGLGVMRYRLTSSELREPRAIIVGAPHTSNWDFAVMLALAWTHELTPKVLIKKSHFRGPKGAVVRALGGIPVDRSDQHGLVADLVGRAGQGDTFHLVITPEGTRSRGTYWKSGFYRIALAADLPVVLGYVDRPTRTTGLGPTIRLTGDMGVDMDVIRDFYRDKHGIKPQNATPPLLRDEVEERAERGLF